ncbi:hypothetical protein LTR92_005357 [Exophiala xenobiotica]|nr:hypothetical protein LTR92_005357 [Exophiala xenobiotica]
MVGYDELSELIGSRPDLTIFRRFGPLAAQVLLRMQAELLDLDDDLKALRDIELQKPGLCDQAKSWAKVNDAVKSGQRSLRKETIAKAEETLTRYYEFASRAAAVMKLEGPDKCDLDFLRGWLENETGGDNFLRNHGTYEATAWSRECADDLMALNRRPDRFAAWVSNALLPIYHARLGHRWHKSTAHNNLGSIYHYDDQKFVVIGDIICTILSVVIPSLSIFVLYHVRSMLVRLLLILSFSSLLSLVMALISQGKRYEIFAATTAFAAVQVAFVGGVTVVSGAQCVVD